jgi:hypothetical protein
MLMATDEKLLDLIGNIYDCAIEPKTSSRFRLPHRSPCF